MSWRKGVALHGGVAATVAGVALHCATKVPPQSGRVGQIDAPLPSCAMVSMRHV